MKSSLHLRSARLRLPRQAFRFCLYVSRKYAHYAIPALFAVLIAQAAGVSLTYILKELIDSLSGSDDSMWRWALIYLGLYTLSTASWRTSGLIGMQWITRSRLHSASVLYDWLSQHSSHYFADRFAGSLATKVTNASNGVNHMLSKVLWEFFPTVLRLVLSMVLAWLAKPILALMLGGWALIFLTLNAFLVRRKAVYSKAVADSYTRLKGQMIDIPDQYSSGAFICST